jgi:hypothetical protein
MWKLVVTLSLLLLAVSSEVQAQYRVMPGIRVSVAPPALRHEVVPMAPSPRHQWIAGYWGWRGGAHLWIGGHWALPPGPGYAWEPSRWEEANGAQMFYDGHWRSAEQVDPSQVYQPPPPPMNQVVTEVEPPPPIVEVRPVMPFADAVWLAGYWHWNGNRHVWVGGRWSAHPEGHGWEAHRWDHRSDGRWVQQPGHWHPEERRPEGPRRR